MGRTDINSDVGRRSSKYRDLAMDYKKQVVCPNCEKNTNLTWWPKLGIFRGYCHFCKKLLYSREDGETWVIPKRPRTERFYKGPRIRTHPTKRWQRRWDMTDQSSRLTSLATELVQAHQMLTEAINQVDFDTARLLINGAANQIEQVVSKLALMATSRPTKAGHGNWPGERGGYP